VLRGVLVVILGKEVVIRLTSWQLDLGQVAHAICLDQLINNRLGQVLPWDQVEYRVSRQSRSGEQSCRRKGQDEGEGVCEDHFRGWV
jgi:hypothetical protein